MLILFLTTCIIMINDAMIFKGEGIGSKAMFETRTLQTMYRLRPVYFEQIPIASITGQSQFVQKQTNNNPSIQPVFYNSLSCKELIWLFMFATMSFLTAIFLWKIGLKLYCIIIGVYKALKA